MTDHENNKSGSINRRVVLQSGAALGLLSMTKPIWAQTGTEPVVLITGTSSGFGRLMAEGFAKNGAQVIATMRDLNGKNAAAAQELRSLTGFATPIEVVEIDVLSDSVGSNRHYSGDRERQPHRHPCQQRRHRRARPGRTSTTRSFCVEHRYQSRRRAAPLPRGRSAYARARQRHDYSDVECARRAIDPMLGGYCASKLAVEAAADALGYEVAASNIEVAVVQPAGAYPTQLQANAIRYWDRMLTTLNETDRTKVKTYAPHIEAMLADLAPDATLDPHEVSDAVISLAATKFGTRASWLTVGPYKDGIDPVNAAHEQLQNDMISHNRIADLLTLKS